MSDNFEMIVDTDVSIDDANELSRAVLAEFRTRGLITGRASNDCVLGGKGYRPGPSVPNLYQPQKNEGRFWELVTCGVESQVGRRFNEWALGPICEGFACPSCEFNIPPFDDEFDDAFSIAIGEWMHESGAARVRCPKCSKKSAVTKWYCKPPLGFGNLSLRFWNWPPFDLPGWQLDIPALVRDITGHTIIRTYGHI